MLDISNLGGISQVWLACYCCCRGCSELRLLQVEISESGLRSLAEGCPGLISLDMTAVAGVNDDGLFPLAQHCRLTHLNVARCTAVTNVGLKVCSV